MALCQIFKNVQISYPILSFKIKSLTKIYFREILVSPDFCNIVEQALNYRLLSADHLPQTMKLATLFISYRAKYKKIQYFFFYVRRFYTTMPNRSFLWPMPFKTGSASIRHDYSSISSVNFIDITKWLRVIR